MITQSLSTTLFSELKARMERRQARVAIIGLGYVGLPLALLYSEQKFPVTGFDIDQVSTLAQGGSYIFRIAVKSSRPGRVALRLPPTTRG
jgi:UDP-N-acetyl-D-glucosamine dehydrogenase